MEAKGRQYQQPQWRSSNLMENLFIVILAFYPLRHISLGIDLWDTGYNYANFQFMGEEHIGSVWLFSTYLANMVGSWLTRLPSADTLRGMNLYTGLFVSVLALTGYFFCTRKLKIPKGIAFVGEMAAISLCWCPTALLYNYLTYVLFLGAFILLYLGLTKENRGFLAGAGILLGTNVLVRFPNLSEMAMIVAVWAYDIILWLEERKENRMEKMAGLGRQEENAVTARGSTEMQKEKREFSGFWKRILGHTLWCFLGYAGALAVLLGYIHICYGIDAYFGGIVRLFGMTDTAMDYKPKAMIMSIVGDYVEQLYWVSRIGIILLGGMVLFAVEGWLEERLRKKGKGVGAVTAGVTDAGKDSCEKAVRFLHIGARILWVAVSIAMIVWLYVRKYYSFLFYSYDPIIRLGTVFLMLAMLIAVIRIFHRDSPREEKLVSGMVVLVILLTSIGSNNGVMPAMNNLFVAAPYTLWESWRFLRNAGDKRGKGGLVISSFPAKGFLTAFLALCLFQFGGFGVKFVFAEATGIQEANTFVGNNAILKNVKMNPEKAQWMMEISDYVNENELEGKEVILYGYIPALSYYLQMPPAFNAWPDLDSYSLEVMKEELAELEAMITEKGAEKPVIILENNYALYKEESAGEVSLFPLSEEKRQKIGDEAKWKLLMEFMDMMGYEQTFRNVKFGLYR